MAGTFGESVSAYTTDSVVNASPIAASASATTDVRSNDGLKSTEVSISCSYGTTISGGGLIVYVCKEYATGQFQNIADAPFSFVMAATASAIIDAVFTVPASVGKFTLIVFNPATNSTVTVTVRYRTHAGVYT
jgi:hypothetical protein